MSKEISLFLRENLDYFQSFEDVILYYDNGQHELNRILNFALSAELSTYSYKIYSIRDLRKQFIKPIEKKKFGSLG
ncbi:MAG: hypothetical protein MJZ26_11975 [Fibrobacter sp.]|nr:hypothetical protein [Fibrobacter sp.]